jgi:hypothetical protein
MSGPEGATDWRKLREFAAIDLTRSFVLAFRVESGTLLVDVDLFLTPEHPFYEKPRPSQKDCIRPAVIEFPYCESITSGGIVDDEDLATAAGRVGHGGITGFSRLPDGQYEICGKFGKVLIDAERPILRLKGP